MEVDTVHFNEVQDWQEQSKGYINGKIEHAKRVVHDWRKEVEIDDRVKAHHDKLINCV